MQILVSDDLEPEIIAEIKKMGDLIYKPADLTKAISNADILIVRSATKITKELLNNARNLSLVVRAGVGLDNVDVDACRARKIKVLNTPGASTNAVAELAIALIFSTLRNLPKAHHYMKNGKWDKKNLMGGEAVGKTLGIIGYGRIGSVVGQKAHTLGMKIIAYNPPPRLEDGIAQFVELEELLPQADVISLHTILTDETRNMINKTSLSKMKKDVIIINTARGELIDEDALYDACKKGKVAAAALDVFKQEPYKGKLLELDNVYFTPHLGASTREAQLRIGQELIKILQEYK